LPVARAELRRIDARRWFGVAVDACLFRVDLGPGPHRYEAAVYADLEADAPEAEIGVRGTRVVADLARHRRIEWVDGACPLTWRQGVKHDAASVLEVVPQNGAWRNRLGERVLVEPEVVYPLLKGGDLHHHPAPQPRYALVLPQRRLGEDTRTLEHTAPDAWRYLLSHEAHFAARKSSIYRGRAPFSVFGIGDYSFSPFKVAVSGMHKEPRFRPVGSHEGRPVLLDDTCYFLPVDSAEAAAIIVALLETPPAIDFLRATVFRDAKRPITKRLLGRIDLRAILRRTDHGPLLRRAARIRDALGPPDAPPAAWASPERYLDPHGPASAVQGNLFG
jgi:hypothetical protein